MFNVKNYMLFKRLLMNQNKFNPADYFTLSVTDGPSNEYGFRIQWAGTKSENSLQYCINGGLNWRRWCIWITHIKRTTCII